MLQNIDPLLTPELLKVLCEMGHGDELVLQPAAYMQVGGSAPGYRSGLQRAVIAQSAGVDPTCDDSKWEAADRFAFYERVARAYAIVQTGEMQAWGNVMFKRGVVADRLRA